MNRALIGCTGFVGSNLAASVPFDGLYHSKDVELAYGTRPDLLVYAGVRAEKFLANRKPDLDRSMIQDAENNIARVRAKRVVLISTVDVYPHPRELDESSEINIMELEPYGANRLELERWVAANCPEHLIVRLPALFGRNLKKNFIYDLTHPVPRMLSADLYERFSRTEPAIRGAYAENAYGFYVLKGSGDMQVLGDAFDRLGFDSRFFTDSRSRFQFLDLSRLWKIIERALTEGQTLLNAVTEPISAAEICEIVLKEPFNNIKQCDPADYDLRSVHAVALGGCDGYLIDRDEVLRDLSRHFDGKDA